jgi:hypothetical protein
MELQSCFCGICKPATLQMPCCRYVIGTVIDYDGTRTLRCIYNT